MLDIEARRNDTRFVEMAVELDDDFAWAMVVDDLEFANVSWIEYKILIQPCRRVDVCLDCSPWRCMTLRNLTTTLDEGLMSTWRFPRRSALTILFKQSFCIKLCVFNRERMSINLRGRICGPFWALFILWGDGDGDEERFFGLSVFGNQVWLSFDCTVPDKPARDLPTLFQISVSTSLLNDESTWYAWRIRFHVWLHANSLVSRVVFVLKPPRELRVC